MSSGFYIVNIGESNQHKVQWASGEIQVDRSTICGIARVRKLADSVRQSNSDKTLENNINTVWHISALFSKNIVEVVYLIWGEKAIMLGSALGLGLSIR